MKTHQCVIAILLTAFFFNVVKAQQIKLEYGSGYSLGITPLYVWTSTQISYPNENNSIQKIDKFSYSEGFVNRLNFMYQLNHEISLSIGGNFIYKNNKTITPIISNNYSNPTKTESSLLNSWRNEILELQSGISLNSKINDKISLQMSWGLLFNLYSKNININDYSELKYNDSIVLSNLVRHEEFQYKSNRNIGFYYDLGISYAINSRFDIFLSTSIRARTYRFNSRKIIKYSENEIDLLSTVPINELEINYYDEALIKIIPDKNEPGQRVKLSQTNGTLTTLIGIRYNLGSLNPEIKQNTEFKKLIYLSFQSGLGLRFNSSAYANIHSEDLRNFNQTAVPYSFGKGRHYSVLMGYQLKNGLSFEIGGIFNKSEISRTFYLEDSDLHHLTYDDITHSYKAKMWRITNGIRLEKRKKTTGVYLRTGLSIGIGSKIIYEFDEQNGHKDNCGTWGNNIDYTKKYYGGISLGTYGSIGIIKYVNPKRALFAELDIIVQNWSPNKSKMTRYVVNKYNKLSNSTISQIETEYYLNYESNGISSPNEPSKSLKETYPFSAAVLKVGVRVNL